MYGAFYDEFPDIVKIYEERSSNTFYSMMDAGSIYLVKLLDALHTRKLPDAKDMFYKNDVSKEVAAQYNTGVFMLSMKQYFDSIKDKQLSKWVAILTWHFLTNKVAICKRTDEFGDEDNDW